MSFEILSDAEIAKKCGVMSAPFPLINAVIDSAQAGKIFALDDNFFVLHKAGFGWFKPGEGFDDYNVLLNFLTGSKEIPEYFHVYDAPAALTAICHANSATANTRLRKRIQLIYKDQQFNYPPDEMSQGSTVKKITSENIASLKAFNLQIDNKFWKSEEDFLVNGFGYIVFNESGEPASVCYSASLVRNTAEIDVATLQPFRQKGFAKIAVAAFVKHCCENNIVANWDCFEDNAASLKIASGVGFAPVLQYEFLSIFKSNKGYEDF